MASTAQLKAQAVQRSLLEELQVLRHTFGLDCGPLPEYCNGQTHEDMPKTLLWSKILDALIVAIDIEGGVLERLTRDNGQYQIGVAILDTRHIYSQLVMSETRGLIHTQDFCVGPESYFIEKSRKSCFGPSRHLSSLSDLRSEIGKLISGRDVILVLHGGESDLEFLKAAEIDLRPLYTIDTQIVAQLPLNLPHKFSLERLLTLLNCPFEPEMFHNANFTLRALLLIAVLDAKTRPSLEPACEDLVSTLETIAREFTGMRTPLEKFRQLMEDETKAEKNRTQMSRQLQMALLKEERMPPRFTKQKSKNIPKVGNKSNTESDYLNRIFEQIFFGQFAPKSEFHVLQRVQEKDEYDSPKMKRTRRAQEIREERAIVASMKKEIDRLEGNRSMEPMIWEWD